MTYEKTQNVFLKIYQDIKKFQSHIQRPTTQTQNQLETIDASFSSTSDI